jgi:hypothetical protein
LDRRIARPIKVSIPEQINDCPECHGKLKYGSRDLAEADYWWCSVCGYGPIKYPLFGGPEVAQITKVKELLGIIDAEKEQEKARIERLLAQGRRYQETGDVRSFTRPVIIAEEPVPGYREPSPHPYLDKAIARINQEQAVVRKVTSHVK